MKTCTRCGRKLKDKKSIELEFGPVCYKKYLEEQAEIGFAKDQMTIDEFIGHDSAKRLVWGSDEFVCPEQLKSQKNISDPLIKRRIYTNHLNVIQ